MSHLPCEAIVAKKPNNVKKNILTNLTKYDNVTSQVRFWGKNREVIHVINDFDTARAESLCEAINALDENQQRTLADIAYGMQLANELRDGKEE